MNKKIKSELVDRRMEVAVMLNAKKTYVEIAEKTGASTATISRVNRCLHYGTDGYKLAISRVYGDGAQTEETEEAEQ